MLYIRHAQKAYSNGASIDFSLDPGLTEKGREAARTRFRELLKIYGTPSKIISSPYLRARETAQIAREVILELNNVSVEITYDSLIGEYLGHHHGKDIAKCLRPETLSYSPIPPEEWKQYSTRVRKHTKLVSQSLKPITSIENVTSRMPKRVWCITHGIIIKSIAFFHGYQIDYPAELSGITVDSSGVTTI